MLPNHTGSAPGMLLHWQQHLIIAMPGPPGEMRPMFEASVAPLLRARWAGRHRLEIAVQTNVADESLLNPLFEQGMADDASGGEGGPDQLRRGGGDVGRYADR